MLINYSSSWQKLYLRAVCMDPGQEAHDWSGPGEVAAPESNFQVNKKN